MEGEKSSVEHVSRLERKRIREQQRRVEEGQAFEQLAKVLGQVNGGSESEVDFAHMSRVELVQSSTIALRKLQKEILSLQRAARANGKDEVTLIVPVLKPVSTEPPMVSQQPTLTNFAQQPPPHRGTFPTYDGYPSAYYGGSY